MASNAVEAMTNAMNRTRKVLFDPFDPAKYLALALAAWLYGLGTGGGFNVSVPDFGNGSGSGGSGGLPDFSNLSTDQLMELAAPLLALGSLLVVIVVVVFVFSVALGALFLFLQSRGAFMLIDSIVKDRGDPVASWTEYGKEANALFVFRALLTGAVFLGATAVMVATGGAIWFSLSGGAFGALQVGIGLLGLLVLILASTAAGIVDGCSTEFVAPLMYARRYGVMDGYRELVGLFSADPGGFVVFLLLRVVAGIAVAFLMVLFSCLMCCVSWLPFVSTVVLLPFIVWSRSYGLYFLAQLHDELRVLGPTPGESGAPLAF